MLTPIWSKPSQSPPSASTSGVKAIPTCSTSTGEAITAAGLMEKISRIVENAPEEPSQTEIIELLKDDGSSARKTTVLTAINRLLEGEWISNRSGRNNRNIYASVRPYRQMNDPKSDAFVDRMSREEANELEDENHLEI